MESNASFVLNPHEAIIDDAKVIYEGKRLFLDTFGYGIIGTIGFIQSTTRPREEFSEKCFCKLILTNQRILFIQLIERLGKDAILGPMHSSITLNSIESVHIKAKFLKDGFFLILSINSKTRNDEVRINFLDDKEFREKPKNQQLPEYWASLIENSIRNSLQEVIPSVIKNQDPIKVLQMRLINGEISEEEYTRLKNLLDE